MERICTSHAVGTKKKKKKGIPHQKPTMFFKKNQVIFQENHLIYILDLNVKATHM